MPRIRIGVQGKVATNLTPEVEVVCRNSDYQVEFEFDETWVAHELKTALVVYNGGSVAVPFSGAVCALPTIYNANMCAVGVFAGDLVTTTPAYLVCKKSIGDLAKYEIEEPPVDVYNQLVQMIESGMLKGEAGKSVLYYAGDFGKETLDDHLASVSNMSEKPNVGDLVVTRDGVLCEVTMVIDEHACMLTFLAYLRGEKGEKGDAGSIRFIMVSVLPIDGIDPTAIYLVPQVGSVEGNMYDEFIYAHGAWEKLGGLTVNIDHSEYVKFTDYAGLNKAGVVKGAGEIYGISIDENGMISLASASQSEVKQKLASKALQLHQIDLATKEGVTNNNIELTDEEKANACAWLGALKINTSAGNKVYTSQSQSDGTIKQGVTTYGTSVVGGAIVARNGSGAILANAPTEDNHVANKKYVDDAVANASGGSADLSDYVKKSAFNTSYGMKISNGYVMLNAASESDITTGTNQYKGITPNRVDFLVKKGITANKLTLSDTEKAAACAWLGVDDKISEVETVLDGIIALQNTLIGGSV